jgi:hypothetical protein
MTSTVARVRFARGEGHALGGVAGADGQTPPASSSDSFRDGVHRAPDLERPDWLEDFELQENLRQVAAHRIEPDERRAPRDSRNSRNGGANGVDGDVSNHVCDQRS